MWTGMYPSSSRYCAPSRVNLSYLAEDNLADETALPLQIHPNTTLAAKLHDENPDQFPDKNHKPEIAVCLSDRFLGFASFRPASQIRALLNATPEVQQLSASAVEAVKAVIGGKREEDGEDASNERVKRAWRAILECDGPEAKKAVEAFTDRVSKNGSDSFSRISEIESAEADNLVEAIKVLDEYNRGDAAIFASMWASLLDPAVKLMGSLFMNLVELKRGEGIYVRADGPHAWLRGGRSCFDRTHSFQRGSANTCRHRRAHGNK